MSRTSSVFVASLLLLSSFAAHADVQKNVQQVWPGKVMIGVRPLGAQLQFNDAWVGRNGTGFVYGVGDRALYKLALDFAGIVGDFSKVTLWLGGEVNVGGRGNLAMFEPGIFVQLTLEKLLHIPLVPLVRFGISGPLYAPYGYAGTTIAGAVQFKVGAGVYYFLTRHIGVGAEMDFAFGPGFQKDANDVLRTGFSGYWDFTAGARFAF